jgi:beta-glucosidase
MKNRSSDSSSTNQDEHEPPYKNSTTPIEGRLRDLIGRMTLDEKVAQMQGIWQQKADKLVDASGKFDPAKARAAFGHGNGLGQVGRLSDAGSSGHDPSSGRNAREQAELANAVQRFFIEESRLGITVFIHEECLH